MKNLILSFILISCMNPLIFSQDQRLSVTGIAEVSETPEMIILNANLRVTAPEYRECFEKSMETYNQLKSVFEENGIPADKIKSRQIVVNENVEWRANEKVILGYYANIQFEIKDEFTRQLSASLLNSLNTEDLNLNYNVNFDFTEEQKARIREEALELAIADAKEKAKVIAKASGIELTRISKINYGTSGMNFPISEFVDDDLARNQMAISTRRFDMGEVDLNPKEKTIRKVILVEWGFKEEE